MTVNETGQNLGYLLSLPRSGSTLLSAMLNNHPAITSPPEPWIMLALHSLGAVHGRHPADAGALGTAFDLFADEEMRTLGARAAAGTLYNHYLKTEQKRFFIDKTPRYYLILDFILNVFPDAKLIWLQRNPFAIAASYKSTWQLDIPNMLRNGEDHPVIFDLICGIDSLERFYFNNGDRMHALHYERLVFDPVEELRSLTKYLGLPVPDETLQTMIDLRHLNRTAQQFGDRKILKTSAPHTTSRDQWKSDFSIADLQILLDALGRERLTRLGYADAVSDVMDLGVIDNGPDKVREYTQRCRRLIASRLSDIEQSSSYQTKTSEKIRWNIPLRD